MFCRRHYHMYFLNYAHFFNGNICILFWISLRYPNDNKATLVREMASPNRLQVITWIGVDQVLWHYMLSLARYDVIKWKHFQRYLPFVRGIHRWPASDNELWCILWSAPEWFSKQRWGWWFETPSSQLWRHCNVTMGWRSRWLSSKKAIHAEQVLGWFHNHLQTF